MRSVVLHPRQLLPAVKIVVYHYLQSFVKRPVIVYRKKRDIHEIFRKYYQRVTSEKDEAFAETYCLVRHGGRKRKEIKRWDEADPKGRRSRAELRPEGCAGAFRAERGRSWGRRSSSGATKTERRDA